MSFILFDTLKLSRTLRDKGHFTTEQAEALAEALNDASQENLATKLDIAFLKGEVSELRAELKSDIAGVRSELYAMKSDLLKWIIGAIGFQTLAILGAVFALAKFLKP